MPHDLGVVQAKARLHLQQLGTYAEGMDKNMTTKTISVDLDAYDRLRRARIRSDESFSQVIKRARWDAPPSTAAALLKALEQAPVPDEGLIQRWEAAQREDAAPEDAWTELR